MSSGPGAGGAAALRARADAGKLLLWVLLFVLAAVVVVLGGVYLT